MNYKIIASKTVDDHLFTTVEYDLDDGYTLTAEVVHFRPKDLAEVKQSLANRAASEKIKALATVKAADVGSALPIGVTIEI